MKNLLLTFFSIIIIAVMIGIPVKAYTQESGDENKTEITETKNSKLFNEGGYVKGLTTARVIGLVELLLGLSSMIIAIRSKKFSATKSAKLALLLGLLAVVFSIVHFITAAGAVFGSGSGKAGAILAFVLGLVGIALGSWVLRQRKV
jgi:hypothetical protein